MKRTLVTTAAASLTFALALAWVSFTRGGASAQGMQSPVAESAIPQYPPIARTARASGKVVVEVEIDREGRVASAESSEGHPLLRKAAETAAWRWRFSPALFNTRQSLTFDFRLDPPKEGEEVASPFYAVALVPRPPDTVSHIPDDHENKTCEVHGFKLERDKVKIAYGLPLDDPDEREASKGFPNSNSWVGGGCEVSAESPKFAEVLYCRACRAAEEEWRERRKAGLVPDLQRKDGAKRISDPPSKEN